MPEIDDLRDRLHQPESIVFELPNLMNVRLDGIESHIRSFRLTLDNTGARLGQVEKVMGLVQADMRDLRSGVTLQLRLQNEQLKGVDTRLQSVETQLKLQGERLGQLEARQERVEQRLDGVEKRLDGVEKRLDGVEKQLAGVVTLLGAVAVKLGVSP